MEQYVSHSSCIRSLAGERVRITRTRLLISDARTTLYYSCIYNCLPEEETSVSKQVEDILN
jgi:hypothetical protein